MNDGGQAFPGPVDLKSHLESGGEPFYNSGMTYRQWLIGMALSGMAVAPDYAYGPANAHIAERAIAIADRIIGELEKEGK